MTNIDNKKISTAVDEAARLLKENPTWTFKKAIDEAKQILKLEVANDSIIC